jgi:DNA segregation ATPase FtsK/SpoIIIE, S-DNA-T family
MAKDQVVRRKTGGAGGPSPSRQSRKLFNEISGLVLFGLGIVFLLALISYDSTDPSWNASGPQTKAHNWIGPVGALLGDALYQALGYAALIIPFALFALAWWRLIDPRPAFSSLKVFGLGLLGFALTGLLALAEGCGSGASFQSAFHSGGWFGHVVVCDVDYGLTRFFNTAGSVIVLSVIFLSGLIVTTPFSLVALIMRLTPREREAGVLRTLSERFRSWRQMRGIERERKRQGAIEREEEQAKQKAATAEKPAVEVRSARPMPPDASKETKPADELEPEVHVVRKGRLTTLGLSELFNEKPATLQEESENRQSVAPSIPVPSPAVIGRSELELLPSEVANRQPAAGSGEVEDADGDKNEEIDGRVTAEIQPISNAEATPVRKVITAPYASPAISELAGRSRRLNPLDAAKSAAAASSGLTVNGTLQTGGTATETDNGKVVPRGIASRLAERLKSRNLANVPAESSEGSDFEETPQPLVPVKLRSTGSLDRRAPGEAPERRRVPTDRLVGVPVNRSIAEARQPVEARSTSLVKHLLRQEHKRPTPDMLTASEARPEMADDELRDRAKQLTEKCQEFNVAGVVTQISPGPVVTTFEFKLDPGVKYGRVTGLVDDLCLGLKAESVRIDRIPGKSTVGIEIPNRRREIIRLREVIESQKFGDSQGKLTLALGRTIDGSNYIADLAKMPHLLIAGATGAGKSVALNTILVSLLFKASPDEVKLILIDPKRLELGLYSDIPHLLTPIVTDPKRASFALKWAVGEMENRYKHLAAFGVRNIEQYNQEICATIDHNLSEDSDDLPKQLPYIVIVIDELADLMMVSARDVEESITRLAQMARAVGIHLVLATQRPSTDVITGLIKANFPSRISFRVSSKVDSRVIIDTNGAEGLLGQGDMLFLPPGTSRLIRVHGAYVDEKEVKRIADFIRAQRKPEFDEKIQMSEREIEGETTSEARRDEKYEEAMRIVFEMGRASTSVLQRRLRIGYGRAASIIDAMYHEGVVGPEDGSKPRQVLVPPDERAAFVERLDQMREEMR